MEPVLLKNIDQPDSHRLENYIQGGGFRGIKTALKLKSDNIIQMIKDSGLRGRGGAGFSTGLKWSFIPKDPGLPKYFLCNADESEPGTFKDRLIMEKKPHLLLEGLMIGCYAIGADSGYIYIRGEYTNAENRLEQAIEEAYDKGYLGQNIFGSDFSLDIHLHRGAGAYICGEETALLESIEGFRAQPRSKPPFPALAGLYHLPTVINNVETLACVPSILERGAPWFASIGSSKSPGPKLFSVSGHVRKPGVYEFPMGLTLQKLIFDHCGGVRNDKTVKAVIPGGASAPVLTVSHLDTPMDFESLAAIGSMLGSAGVIVMDETTCMVKTALVINRFFSHESCGKCTPCREGTPWMTQVLERIENGNGRKGDVKLLESLCSGIFGRCFCALGDAAAMALGGFLKNFKDEFLHHIDHKVCLVESVSENI